LHRVHGDFHAAAARNAVEYQRQLGVAADFHEMLEEPFLAGLIVVRGDLERAVRSGGLGGLSQVDGFVGGVGARAGQHLDFARRKFDGKFDDLDVLLDGERGRFAGGAHRHNAVHAALDLPGNELAQGFDINFAVRKRRDDGCVSSSKHFVTMRRLPSGKTPGLASRKWRLERRSCDILAFGLINRRRCSLE